MHFWSVFLGSVDEALGSDDPLLSILGTVVTRVEGYMGGGLKDQRPVWQLIDMPANSNHVPPPCQVPAMAASGSGSRSSDVAVEKDPMADRGAGGGGDDSAEAGKDVGGGVNDVVEMSGEGIQQDVKNVLSLVDAAAAEAMGGPAMLDIVIWSTDEVKEEPMPDPGDVQDVSGGGSALKSIEDAPVLGGKRGVQDAPLDPTASDDGRKKARRLTEKEEREREELDASEARTQAEVLRLQYNRRSCLKHLPDPDLRIGEAEKAAEVFAQLESEDWAERPQDAVMNFAGGLGRMDIVDAIRNAPFVTLDFEMVSGPVTPEQTGSRPYSWAEATEASPRKMTQGEAALLGQGIRNQGGFRRRWAKVEPRRELVARRRSQGPGAKGGRLRSVGCGAVQDGPPCCRERHLRRDRTGRWTSCRPGRPNR